MQLNLHDGKIKLLEKCLLFIENVVLISRCHELFGTIYNCVCLHCTSILCIVLVGSHSSNELIFRSFKCLYHLSLNYSVIKSSKWC